MAKGSGPIQYDDLFNSDVNSKITELSGIVTKLQSDFQGLGDVIDGMSGNIKVKITTSNTALKDMGDGLKNVDVATRGAGATMTDYAKEVENGTKKSADLKAQQDLLNKTFNLATASVDEIKARIKLLTAEYTALGSATDANKAKASALSSQVVGLKNQQTLLTSALVNSKNSLVQAEGSYNQMSITLTKLRSELKDIPNAIDAQTGAWNKNNPAVKEHLEKINQLDGALKKVDGSMGVHTRDVGDYSEKIREALQDLIPFGSQLGRTGQAINDLSPVLAGAIESMGGLAIAAIGVGAAVTAIIAVPIYAWFIGTQEGENAVALETNRLEIAWNHAKEAVINFGGEMVKAFSGETKSKVLNGIVAITKSILSIPSGIFSNIFSRPGDEKLAQEITALSIKIAKNEGDLALNTAKANDEFQKQRDIASDISLTADKHGKELEDGYKKRKEAADAAIEASNHIKDLKVDELKDQRTLLELQLSENKNDAGKIENINKVKAFTAAIYQADADALKEQTRIKGSLRAMEVEQEKGKEAAAKAADDAEKKRIKDADKLLQIQTKTNVSKLESKEIVDLGNARTETEKINIIIKFEQDKLAIIEDGINQREKLYKKDSIDFKNLEAEKSVATAASQKAIEKETEDSLKRQQALQLKYAKLRDEILTEKIKATQSAAEFDVNSTTFKGSATDQETQKQDALYKIKHDALIGELNLVSVKNAAIKDSYEQDLAIAKDTITAVNNLNNLSYANDLRLLEDKKKKLDEMFGYLKENNQVISKLFGSEFGGLFDNLTTDLEKFVKKTGVTLEDWANTTQGGSRCSR